MNIQAQRIKNHYPISKKRMVVHLYLFESPSPNDVCVEFGKSWTIKWEEYFNVINAISLYLTIIYTIIKGRGPSFETN